MPASINARTATAAAPATIASEVAIASAAWVSAAIAVSVARASAACATAITSAASSSAATSAPTTNPASAVRKPSPNSAPPDSATASKSACAQPCSTSSRASAVPGNRDSASAHASARAKPDEPTSPVGSTRPPPPSCKMLDRRAPRSSSSPPTTTGSIVPSSSLATKITSSRRNTPRPCNRSTSANTRAWKSEPGLKLTAITCNGPGISRPHSRYWMASRPSIAEPVLGRRLEASTTMVKSWASLPSGRRLSAHRSIGTGNGPRSGHRISVRRIRARGTRTTGADGRSGSTAALSPAVVDPPVRCS